jgi:hypothetical protein
MVPRVFIVVIALAAIMLGGIAPLADAGGDAPGDAHEKPPCQMLAATPAVAGAALVVKPIDLTTAAPLPAEIIRPSGAPLREPATALPAQRSLLAQHILLRI